MLTAPLCIRRLASRPCDLRFFGRREYHSGGRDDGGRFPREDWVGSGRADGESQQRPKGGWRGDSKRWNPPGRRERRELRNQRIQQQLGQQEKDGGRWNGRELRKEGRPQRRSNERKANDRQHGDNWKAKTSAALNNWGGKERPSLISQLFPEEEAKREEALRQRQHEREVPRIPLHQQQPQSSEGLRKTELGVESILDITSPRQRDYAQTMQNQKDSGVSVLVLRNASNNLVEEDFRRLVPSGQHLEGWSLQQGDILKIIQSRDLSTLAPLGHYYLLFSSPLSAFTYQGHAIRCKTLASRHTPTSIASVLPPQPGQTIDGVDAHAAIQSFTLIPPDQAMDLRQLKPPLTPFIQSIVRAGGYSTLLNRPDRMTYEARLTMFGPQYTLVSLQHILLYTGRFCGINWSGGSETLPRMSKWEATRRREAPSPLSRKPDAQSWGERDAQSADEQMERDSEKLLGRASRAREDGPDDAEGVSASRNPRGTPGNVFILGFETESALQGFIRFWHGRPLHWEGLDWEDGEDAAPEARVERLW